MGHTGGLRLIPRGVGGKSALGARVSARPAGRYPSPGSLPPADGDLLLTLDFGRRPVNVRFWPGRANQRHRLAAENRSLVGTSRRELRGARLGPLLAGSSRPARQAEGPMSLLSCPSCDQQQFSIPHGRLRLRGNPRRKLTARPVALMTTASRQRSASCPLVVAHRRQPRSGTLAKRAVRRALTDGMTSHMHAHS